MGVGECIIEVTFSMLDFAVRSQPGQNLKVNWSSFDPGGASLLHSPPVLPHLGGDGVSRSCCPCRDGGRRSGRPERRLFGGTGFSQGKANRSGSGGDEATPETSVWGADSGVQVVLMLASESTKKQKKKKSDFSPFFFLTSHFMCSRRICEMRNAKLATQRLRRKQRVIFSANLKKGRSEHGDEVRRILRGTVSSSQLDVASHLFLRARLCAERGACFHAAASCFLLPHHLHRKS